MTAVQKLRSARLGMTAFRAARTPEEAVVLFQRVAADLCSAQEKMPAEAKARVRGKPNAKAQVAQIEQWAATKRGAPGDLLTWLRVARNDDLHVAKSATGPRLVARGGFHLHDMHIDYLPPGEEITFGVAGLQHHRNVGTPEEEVKFYEGATWESVWTLVVHDAPQTLRGKPIGITTAGEALDLAYAALREDWDEAEQFGR